MKMKNVWTRVVAVFTILSLSCGMIYAGACYGKFVDGSFGTTTCERIGFQSYSYTENYVYDDCKQSSIATGERCKVLEEFPLNLPIKMYNTSNCTGESRSGTMFKTLIWWGLEKCPE